MWWCVFVRHTSLLIGLMRKCLSPQSTNSFLKFICCVYYPHKLNFMPRVSAFQMTLWDFTTTYSPKQPQEYFIYLIGLSFKRTTETFPWAPNKPPKILTHMHTWMLWIFMNRILVWNDTKCECINEAVFLSFS